MWNIFYTKNKRSSKLVIIIMSKNKDRIEDRDGEQK